MDAETFTVELDTHGFRSQVSAIGAQNLVQRLAFEGCYVTSIIWLRSEGTPADRDADAAVSDREGLQCRQRMEDAA